MTQQLRGWLVLIEAQSKLLLRNRITLISSLGLAIISMLIFGSLLGSDRTAPLKLTVIDADNSSAAMRVVAAFGQVDGASVIPATPCLTCQAAQQLKDGQAAVVIVPAGFGRDLAAGKAALETYYDGSNPAAGAQAQATVTAVLNGVNQAITGTTAPIGVTTQGLNSHPPRQIDWLTPGMAGMMVMWANLAVGAAIIAWREQGILKRLAVTPLRPAVLMLTQIASRLVFSCVQVAVLLVIAWVVFNVQVAGSYWSLALVVVVATLAMLAFGLLIGAFVPKSESAQAVSTLIAFPMMFLGGSYFATDAAPSFLQPVINALPLTHINHALRQIMIYGASVGDLQRDLLVLGAWLAGSLLIATRTFRWGAEAR